MYPNYGRRERFMTDCREKNICNINLERAEIFFCSESSSYLLNIMITYTLNNYPKKQNIFTNYTHLCGPIYSMLCHQPLDNNFMKYVFTIPFFHLLFYHWHIHALTIFCCVLLKLYLNGIILVLNLKTWHYATNIYLSIISMTHSLQCCRAQFIYPFSVIGYPLLFHSYEDCC